MTHTRARSRTEVGQNGTGAAAVKASAGARRAGRPRTAAYSHPECSRG